MFCSDCACLDSFMPPAVWAKLELLHTILATLAPYTAIALIVMFQSRTRRALARLGRRPFLGISQLERRELSQEVMLAVGRMAQTKVGALIVIERKIGLRTFIESGVSLDAQVSRDLLCSIFHPGGTLHDGAVIIQGDRISAAACFLPLTTNPLLVTELGTRHRAALGISEESDCIAIVVIGRDRQGIGRGIWRNRDRRSTGTRGASAVGAAGSGMKSAALRQRPREIQRRIGHDDTACSHARLINERASEP